MANNAPDWIPARERRWPQAPFCSPKDSASEKSSSPASRLARLLRPSRGGTGTFLPLEKETKWRKYFPTGRPTWPTGCPKSPPSLPLVSRSSRTVSRSRGWPSNTLEPLCWARHTDVQQLRIPSEMLQRPQKRGPPKEGRLLPEGSCNN